MKIAVTAYSNTLDAQVDSHFGRCAWFLIVDTDTMDTEAMENPNRALGGGAGIQSGTMLAQRGVSHILTGNCGPNAFQTLAAAGIQIIVGCSGTVRQAVEQFKSGTLSAVNQANVASHFGTGGAMGRGRGLGMGRRSQAPMSPPPPQAQTQPKPDELALLQQQADALNQQMKQIQQRIQELSKNRNET